MSTYRPWRPTLGERLVPVWLGALGLASIVLLRALVFLLRAVVHGSWTGVAQAFLAVGVAALGGAAGGLAYTLVGARLRVIPRAGPYLAGVATIAGYLAAILLLIGFIDPAAEFSLRSSAGRFSFIVCSLFFGLIAGHSWFRD